LQHARRHANLYIDSNNLTPDEVLQKTLSFLAAHEPKSGSPV
jgi:hypothetical protein